jgi:SMI1-KNR4 cell-wall
MSLSKLYEISPPPDHPVDADGDREVIEKQVGMKLPDDYWGIIERYGRGSFADFLNLIHPFSDPDNFLYRLEYSILEHEREMRSEFPDQFPFLVYPEPGGLFPWAGTDNGDTLYWLTVGAPDSWQVVVRESRGPKHVVYPFGAAEFLQRWLSGTLECLVFPRRHEYFDPSFTAHRVLEVATVYFGYVEIPFDQRLVMLMEYFGSKKIKHRHVIQCGFLADPSESRMTYTDIGHHGSWLEMAWPQGEEHHFRTMIGQIPVQLGWSIRFVLRNGQQIWPDVPQTSDPRSRN